MKRSVAHKQKIHTLVIEVLWMGVFPMNKVGLLQTRDEIGGVMFNRLKTAQRSHNLRVAKRIGEE